jgi:hypothetical protein
MDTMDKIKQFEDSVNTIWLPEQHAQITGQQEMIEKAING